jgi:hypothetical protein
MVIDDEASFLLIGDSGTKKTTFIGTCPSPIYVFDFDKGMAVHAGRADIDYDTFKEMPRGHALVKGGRLQKEGWYEYGQAYPAFLKKLNEIGKSIDDGTCKYKTIAIDSLTLLTDCAQTYVMKENNRTSMEIRDWGAFLSNMSNVFGQLTGWPLIKILTAHIKRDENQVTGAIEQLPLVPGQFAGKVSVYFDEVYFCEVSSTPVVAGKPERKTVWTLKTTPDTVSKQAKSRKYNIPNGTPTDFAAIAAHMAKRKAVAA